MTAQALTTDERQTHLPPLGETGWGAVPGRDAIRILCRRAGRAFVAVH
jgi:hypothetical protein